MPIKTIRFKLLPTLFYLCMMPVLISLGFWQLSRSEQKKQLFQQQAQHQQDQAITLTALTPLPLEQIRYQKVQASGHYDSTHQFLLDNQISAGKVGYFVLTPFILDNTTAVLVNRGWIPLNLHRNDLPTLDVPSNPLTITGRLNQFLGVGFKLQGAEIPSNTWPSVVQVIDSKIVAQKLGYPLLPMQLELNPEEPYGYLRDWRTTSPMRPEQHLAYAVQWFALAGVLTWLFFRYNYKTNK